MAIYREPGAYSEVKVSSVLAVTPGGLRVAYLIGKGQTTYATTALLVRASGTVDILDPTGVVISKVYPIALYPEYSPSKYELNGSGNLEWLDTTGIPAEGDQFYIDYTYNKTSADYIPKEFTTMEAVIAEYGPVSTSNPLSIGAQLVFENGASIVGAVQVQVTGNDYTDFEDALNKLEIVDDASIIVPLYASSTFGTSVLKSHVSRMSSKVERKERVGLTGLDETLEAISTASWISLAGALGSNRMGLVYPGKMNKILDEGEVVLDGTFLAAAIAGMMTSAEFDSAEPLTHKDLFGIVDVGISVLNVVKNQLATAGVMIVDKRGITPYIRHGLTTDMTTISGQEMSVTTSIDEVVKNLRKVLEGAYVGTKFLATLPSQVSMTMQTNLLQAIEDELITAFTDLQVKRNAIDPRAVDIKVKVMPVFPCNWLDIEMTLVPIV